MLIRLAATVFATNIYVAQACALIIGAAGMISGSAQAADLKVLSGNGSKPAVIALTKQFEQATGHKVTIDFAVNADVKKRIDAGEAFDATVLNPPVLDQLIKSGKVVAETRAIIGRIGLGVAVKAGAARPDISTVDGFKAALLATKSVAYPGEGQSGVYFVSLIDKLGLTEVMKPKLRPMGGEHNVEAVASGEAEMVVVVASRIYGVPGVDMIGLLPKELQTWIGFGAGVATATKEPAAARAFAQFLTAPAAASVLKPIGIEPFVE
jgi:molybdate transport system substrate-binding protein